jgi:uncharacterized membrane protein YhaH (DUF805 family)
MEAVEAWKKVVLENYAVFEGRANRAEFWWFVLANIVISIALTILARISTLFIALQFIYAIGVIVPGLAVAVRRLHDTGRSGWWYFIGLVPLVGVIILVVFLASESVHADNEYGRRPPPGVTAGAA